MNQRSTGDATEITAHQSVAGGLGRRVAPHGPLRRFLRGFIHFFSYHLILGRRSTRVTRAAGFRLAVRPTVFHPRYFISSECFAKFVDGLDLRGKNVVDVGTGSGILALAAARAGAANVMATDINPNAALTAAENARANGVDQPPLGSRATPALRRDPLESAQARWRTPKSCGSRLARGSKLSRHSGFIPPISRAS
jgi:hypothetical protein